MRRRSTTALPRRTDVMQSSMAMLFRRLAMMMLALLPATVSASDSGRRPNILLAFADDWGRFASAYAKLDGPGTINDALATPNFDRVAREGVLFRSAFVSAPS